MYSYGFRPSPFLKKVALWFSHHDESHEAKNFPETPSLTKVKLGTLEKKEVFFRDEKSVDSAKIFYPDGKRSAERLQRTMNWRHTQTYPDEKKGMVQGNIDPLL